MSRASAASAETAEVVPPGQEQLLASMFAIGSALPAQCKFTAGDADGGTLHATYTCGQDEIVFALHHPDTVAKPAARTVQFAIMVQGGSPPPGLLDALVASIRSHESDFHWLELHLPAKPTVAARQWSGLVAAIIVALALAAAGLLLRRWTRRAG